MTKALGQIVRELFWYSMKQNFEFLVFSMGKALCPRCFYLKHTNKIYRVAINYT